MKSAYITPFCATANAWVRVALKFPGHWNEYLQFIFWQLCGWDVLWMGWFFRTNWSPFYNSKNEIEYFLLFRIKSLS